jgi:hypothetical protein
MRVVDGLFPASKRPSVISLGLRLVAPQIVKSACMQIMQMEHLHRRAETNLHHSVLYKKALQLAISLSQLYNLSPALFPSPSLVCVCSALAIVPRTPW